MERRSHWEGIYTAREPEQVSWYQPRAALSLEIILQSVPDRAAPLLDVGGGASTLVDGLVEAGYRSITLLDVSETALERVRRRLAERAAGVNFVAGDVLTADLPASWYHLWHDRAAFHFLTDPADRTAYLDQVRRSVVPGGWVLMATFAEDGPIRCSGLEVVRYSPSQLHAALGRDFDLADSRRERHVTPSGAVQWFTYCLFAFLPPSRGT